MFPAFLVVCLNAGATSHLLACGGLYFQPAFLSLSLPPGGSLFHFETHKIVCHLISSRSLAAGGVSCHGKYHLSLPPFARLPFSTSQRFQYPHHCLKNQHLHPRCRLLDLPSRLHFSLSLSFSSPPPSNTTACPLPSSLSSAFGVPAKYEL